MRPLVEHKYNKPKRIEKARIIYGIYGGLTMFPCLTHERVLHRVNINIGDCSQWKILSKLDHNFF